MKKVSILFLFWTCSVLASTPTEYTKGMKAFAGFVDFYTNENAEVYWKIDKFNQPFIYQTSLPQGLGSNDIGLDRGQLSNTRLVQFERIGNKVLLRQLNTYFRANTDNKKEKEAIEEAFANSIIWGFEVVAQDKRNAIVNATPFLLQDAHGVADRLAMKQQGNYKVDASRSALNLNRTKAFPLNSEFEAFITFTGKADGDHIKSVAPDASSVSVRIHHSFIKLPDNKYKPRKFDPRSGFWSFEFMDYATPFEQSITQRWIPRHRLAKVEPTAAKSAAVKPIIYYLDPGIPEPVRSALLEGALWWNQAFEAAGYENAFQVKVLPDNADPMDVRYNVIQWVHRSTRGWSYGSSVIDPRTGEIIKGHVTLGSLRVRQDFLIATGMSAPFGEGEVNIEQQKSMALARIKQLSAHEIGHTLGIAHNFAASGKNRASVMDYPHPYIHLDGQQNISFNNAYAENIGEWDKQVILYGYGDFSHLNEEKVLKGILSQNELLGFQFISDPDSRSIADFHPTSHLWDNGVNASEELDRLLKLRQVALTRFNHNVIPDGAPYSDLEEALVPVYFYHRYQQEAVGKLIGGIHFNYAMKDKGTHFSINSVTVAEQKAALAVLLKSIQPSELMLPESIENLIPPKAYGYAKSRESTQGYTGKAFDPLSLAEASTQHVLSILLHPERLARVYWQHAKNNQQMGLNEIFKTLTDQLIKNDLTERLQAIQMRQISSLVSQLISLAGNDNASPEVRAQSFNTLTELHAWFKTYYNKSPSHRNVYLWQAQIIEQFKSGQLQIKSKTMDMPPGSPIGN